MTTVEYSNWTRETFGVTIPVPTGLFTASFEPSSKWGNKAHNALIGVELEYVEALLASIRDYKVSGAIVEFGIFEGWWINHLFEVTERLRLLVPVLGFDSFQGLSAPHLQFDGEFWKEGMYSASRQLVEKKVKASARPRIQLFEGFFAESLTSAAASEVGEIAYARIDCDIYEPAVECLQYLSNRLSHGSILVLDDWPHQVDIGEGRAFAEWVPTVPHLRFEFLFFGTWGHFYIRVWHRDREPFPELAAGVQPLDETPAPAPVAGAPASDGGELPRTPKWPRILKRLLK
jgi:hypothetical protein